MGEGWVLVVDDDEDTVDVVVETLTEAGIQARGTLSGADAIDILRGIDRPSVVVADVRMPGVSGVDLVRHVAGDVELRAIPIVLVTGSAADDLPPGLDVQVVYKPFDSNDLITRVAQHLRPDADNARS